MPRKSSRSSSLCSEDILYEDEYCELTEELLKIKKYFFPTLKPKIVHVKDIRVVYFDEQKEAAGYASRRSWGMGKNDTYWAADFARCLPGDKHGRVDVIVDIEDGEFLAKT